MSGWGNFWCPTTTSGCSWSAATGRDVSSGEHLMDESCSFDGKLVMISKLLFYCQNGKSVVGSKSPTTALPFRSALLSRSLAIVQCPFLGRNSQFGPSSLFALITFEFYYTDIFCTAGRLQPQL
ncbi:hypothetical protein CLAIMM_04387 [Cladophialophora immunda]|nr:hypothetical protein CLAIMM_04387 [Cladophialophora immunda]